MMGYRTKCNGTVRIPSAILQAIRIDKGDNIEFILKGSGVFLRKCEPAPKTKKSVRSVGISAGFRKIQEWERVYGTGL
ncbi:AbrB/MazE/SpoVT family DNA-binding domain-containing protein [Anaerotruncus sp. AF02-27]|nr:AbrB/MazE/SpoVT family DNA-binding domain-containing protein [Anaerotruncus sp. AF02-27]